METKLKKHLEKIQAYNRERQGWLYLSGFVTTVIIGIVTQWDKVVNLHLLWLIVSCGFTITAIWWFWTMKIVRHLVDSKTEEYELLSEVVQDIREIKQDVKKSFEETRKD